MEVAPPELSEVLQSLLRPEEEILWVEQPIPYRVANVHEPFLWLGFIWFAINIIPLSKWIRLCMRMNVPTGSRVFYAFIGVIWFFAATAVIVHWLWEYFKARHCYYALTSRRALILHGFGRRWRARALMPSQMNQFAIKRC